MGFFGCFLAYFWVSVYPWSSFPVSRVRLACGEGSELGERPEPVARSSRLEEKPSGSWDAELRRSSWRPNSSEALPEFASSAFKL